MAPPWAIAREYRGLHTGWETARGTVQKAAQCRLFAKRQRSRGFSRHYRYFCCVFVLTAYIDADEPV
jgi:hypothetical protein